MLPLDRPTPGSYFPSSDNKWKNANSETFLKFATDKMQSLGYKINNIDITIVLQSPSLKPYNKKIRIKWPIKKPIVSKKDKNAMTFFEFKKKYL